MSHPDTVATQVLMEKMDAFADAATTYFSNDEEDPTQYAAYSKSRQEVQELMQASLVQSFERERVLAQEVAALRFTLKLIGQVADSERQSVVLGSALNC